MTAQRTGRTARTAAAAAVRAAPDAPPAGTPAVRTKPYRVTLDLDPKDYASLNRWLLTAAAQINPDDPRRLSLARALRAAIHAMTTDTVVADVVLDLLRQERAQST